MLAGMKRLSALVLLLACACVHAQIPLEDFANTACGRGEPVFHSGLEAGETAVTEKSSIGNCPAAGALATSSNTGNSKRFMRQACPAQADGMLSATLSPPPSRLARVRRPPWASTISRASARPSPVPLRLVE